MIAGFLGTRASVWIDATLVVFIAMPFAMAIAIVLARRGQHRTHRAMQVALLASMTTAVLVLEISLRLSGGALAGRPHWSLIALFVAHVVVAVATFIAWAALVVRSWRRFGRTLPGPFFRPHRRWGYSILAGLIFVAASGTALYAWVYAGQGTMPSRSRSRRPVGHGMHSVPDPSIVYTSPERVRSSPSLRSSTISRSPSRSTSAIVGTAIDPRAGSATRCKIMPDALITKRCD